VSRQHDEEDVAKTFPAMALNLDGSNSCPRYLKRIKFFHSFSLPSQMGCPCLRWPAPKYRNRRSPSIRQYQAHQRHHSNSETYQQHCVFDGHNRNCLQGPRGNDCGREVVKSFRVMSGCDFHTSCRPYFRCFRNALAWRLDNRTNFCFMIWRIHATRSGTALFVESSSKVRGVAGEPINTPIVRLLLKAVDGGSPRR